MPLKKRSILIVDTDAFLAGMYARRFEAKRWSVRVAEQAADARATLMRKPFDALILDVDAVKDGWELLAETRKEPRSAGMLVLVLTTLGDRRSIKHAQEIGADGYMLKGHFVPSEVVEKVERLVVRRQDE